MPPLPKRPREILELNLLENAHSFVCEALAKAIAAEQSPQQWKFAILHLVQAIELSLKELLKQQHPILIYKSVDKPDTTVSLEGALGRLKLLTSFAPTEDELNALQFSARVRNEIVHHEFKADAAELKPAFARLFGFLVDLHRTHFDYTIEEVVPKPLWLDGVKIKEYGEELYRRAKVRLAADNLDDDCLIDCPKCGWRALSGFGDQAERCYVCGHVTALAVCDRCNCVMLWGEEEESGEKTYCRSCFEFINDDYWHDAAKEGGL